MCTAFLYRNGEILAECGEDGEPVSRYVYGRGLSHVQTLRDGIYHAYHCDEQGSTAYMTGPGGGVENSYRYDAFGNLLERKETVPNRILYTGQQYDQETGQYYLRARYYNPVVGRFLQEDTYHGDGLNLYAYCANNPVVYYDPSGHDSAAVMKKAEEPDLPVGVVKADVNLSFANNIDDVLAKQGLTLDEFNLLRLKDVSTLSNTEKAALKAVRESVPIPDTNTLLQKVIPASDLEKYMNGTYTQVGGYITRAEDVAKLTKYDELYESLRLDYPGSVYNPLTDSSIGVIRYTTDEVSKISIPYGVEMGGIITDAPPFTGNGFTKATNGEIIPEFKCNGYIDVSDGA